MSLKTNQNLCAFLSTASDIFNIHMYIVHKRYLYTINIIQCVQTSMFTVKNNVF